MQHRITILLLASLAAAACSQLNFDTPAISEHEARNIAVRALAAKGYTNIQPFSLRVQPFKEQGRAVYLMFWASDTAPLGGPIADITIDARTGEVVQCHVRGSC